MPVWTMHSIDRYLLVPAEGEPVLWEYASAPPELVSPYPGLETRAATSWAVFGFGERAGDRAALFAADVAAVLRDRGLEGERIGVDRLDAYGFLALQAAGVHLVPAQLALEQARAVKGPEEIELIRRSLARRRRRRRRPVPGPAPGHDRERGVGPAPRPGVRAGRRVLRVPPAVVRAADEPVVPRGRRPSDGARRPGGVRHRPHRSGRVPGRSLPHLSRRIHDAVRAAAAALRRRPGLPRRHHRRAEAGGRPRRGRGAAEPPAARRLPRGALPLHRARQRPE